MFDSASLTLDYPWIREIVFLIYSCTVISIIIIVVSENRNPVKSLAWVTVLLLLPIAGIVLYLFFGRSIKNKRKLSRRNRRRLKKREPRSKASFSTLDLSADSLRHVRLAHSLAGAQIYSNNNVKIFTNGTDKFESLKADLRAARNYINLEYYIFENDRIGTEIADILIERASAGVAVKVIYDHVGSFRVKSKFFKNMRRAGIMVYPFFEVTFPQLGTRINWRNHRKLVVIDGRVGYLGGMNIADRYIDGGHKFESWRDTHIRVEGPIVGALQFSFAVDWHFMGQELPDQEVVGLPSPGGSVNAQLITSGPTSQWTSISMVFLQAISSAKKRIYIQTPYFLPTEALLNGLLTAALSGVDVRIMVPEKSDSRLLDNASSSYVAECLRAGIKFYIYKAGMLHAKMILVDDEFLTVGSTNFDFRSFEHNFEGNLLFYSVDLNAKMREIFATDLKSSDRIMPQQWHKRPWHRKAVESVVRLLSPIL